MNKFRSLQKIVILFLLFSVIQNFNDSSSADELFQIQAKNIKYQNKKNTIIAEGNAEASNSLDKKLFADKITYKKKEGILLANGNVKLVDNKNTITAENIKYNINTKEVNASDNVGLIDSLGNKLFASKLKFNLNTELGEAYNITSNLKDGSYAEADKGNFNKKKRFILFKKNKLYDL